MFSRAKTDDKENIFASPVESISKSETVRLDSDSSLDTTSLATDSSDFAESSSIHCIRPTKRRLPDMDTLLQPLSPVSRIESANKRCRSPSTIHNVWPIPSSNFKPPLDTMEVEEMPSPVFLHSPVFSRSSPIPYSSSTDMSDVTVLSPVSPNESDCIRVLDHPNLDVAKSSKRVGSSQRSVLHSATGKSRTPGKILSDTCEPFLSCLKQNSASHKKDSPDVICLSDSDDDSFQFDTSNRQHADARHSKPKRKVLDGCSSSGKELSRNLHKTEGVSIVELLPRGTKSRSKMDTKAKQYMDDRNVCDNTLVSSIPTLHACQDSTSESNRVLGQLRKSPKCQLFPKIAPVSFMKSKNTSKLVKSPESAKQRSSKSHHVLSIPWNPLSLEKHSRTHLMGESSSGSKNSHQSKKKRAREKESESSDSAACVTNVIPLPLEQNAAAQPESELQIQPTQHLSEHSSGAERMFMHHLHLGPSNSTSEHDIDSSACMMQKSINDSLHGAANTSLHRSSPDPVQLLEQVQSDEMLAQELQAQFDREMSRRLPSRYLPPLTPEVLHTRRRSPVSRLRDPEIMVVPTSIDGSPWPVSTLWGLNRELNREDRLTVALNLLTLQLAYLDLQTPSSWSLSHSIEAEPPFPDLLMPARRALAAPTASTSFIPSRFLMPNTTASTATSPSHIRRRHRHHSGRYPPSGRRNQWDWGWDSAYDPENEYEMLWELTNRIGHVNANTMSEHQINQLPVRFYRSTKGDASRANTCHICLNEYEQGERLRILPCAHEFHLSCIDRWIKDHPTCPICRSDCRP